jgi:tetratricopeptide (TPR) repeat protein
MPAPRVQENDLVLSRLFSRVQPDVTAAVIGAVPAAVFAVILTACVPQQQMAAEQPVPAAKAEMAAAAGPPPKAAMTAPGAYLAGLHAERMGDVAAAADFLRGAIEKDPGNVELMQRGFLFTLSEGDVADATDLAERLADSVPDAALPALTLAVQDFKRGDYKAAEGRLDNLPDSGLNRFFVPLALAWVKSAQGDTEGAIAALDPLAQNSGFAVLRDMHAGLIYDVAGINDAAEESYKNALGGSQGGALRLIQALGSLYERTGRKDEAKALYEEYIAENPDTVLLDPEMKRLETGAKEEPLLRNSTDGLAEALFNVASTLQQQGATLLALSYGRLASVLKPDFPVNAVMIADIYDGQGRGEEAIAIYKTLPKGSPFHWLGRMRIAINLDDMDKTDEALKQLDQMAADRPDRVDALVTMGDILRAHDRFREAAAAYTRAIDRLPEYEERHWPIFYARGIVYERSKQWDKAEPDFLKALELRPDQPYVLNYLAYSWVEKGVHLERAKDMLERAVELRPNDGFIVDSLGWILLAQGDTLEAVKRLETAVELEPQDPTINDHLGDAYWKAGRHTEARFQWRRALLLKPDAEAAARIESKLQHGLSVTRAGAEDSGS